MGCTFQARHAYKDLFTYGNISRLNMKDTEGEAVNYVKKKEKKVGCVVDNCDTH